LGAKDKIPRGRDRFLELKQMIRDTEALHFLKVGDSDEFKGSGLELAQAVYREQGLSLEVRLAAARLCIPFEAPAVQPQIDSTTGEIKFLPVGRDPVAEQTNFDDNKEFVSEQLRRLHRQHVYETDAEVRRWIEAGQTTEAQALLYRPLWTEDGDPSWDQPPPGANRQRVQLLRINHHNGGAHQHNGAHAPADNTVDGQDQRPIRVQLRNVNGLNEHPVNAPKASLPKLVQLYGTPHANYPVGSGYTADQFGIVTADEGDLAALRAMGCLLRH
jgi:hypothetical protein